MATIDKRATRTRKRPHRSAPGGSASRVRKHYVHVGTKGQVVIPADLRRELGLQPGQKLRIETADGRIVATPVPVDLIDQLHGCLADSGDLVGDLMRDHREEIEREEAYLAALDGRPADETSGGGPE